MRAASALTIGPLRSSSGPAGVSLKRDRVEDLRNIGPTVGARLAEIGIRNRADLAALGAPEVYRRLVSKNGGRSLPVCYYLFSIQGALVGVHWDAIGDTAKHGLLVAIGRRPKYGRVR